MARPIQREPEVARANIMIPVARRPVKPAGMTNSK